MNQKNGASGYLVHSGSIAQLITHLLNSFPMRSFIIRLLPYIFLISQEKHAVDKSLQQREAMIIQLFEFHLLQAQHRMKTLGSQHRSKGLEWVWLKLQSHRQKSVQRKSNDKHSPRYFGPFPSKKVIGSGISVGSSSKIHNVFHVTQLKSFRGIHQHSHTFLLGCKASTVHSIDSCCYIGKEDG